MVLQYKPTRFSNLLTDICVKGLKGVEVAKEHDISEARVSQIKTQIKNLIYPPRIENSLVVCYKCGSPDWIGFHHQHQKGKSIAIICQSCNVRVGQNELAFVLTPEEWKEGFKELFDFFQDIMKNINIIKNTEKWNDLLQKRNLVLIDKLRGEL